MFISYCQVFEFLEDISASINELATRELEILKDLKVRIYLVSRFLLCFYLIHLGILGLQRKEEGEVPFGNEDLSYYMKRVEEQYLDHDLGALKQYFPIKLVLPGIFKIFQDLFGNFYNIYFARVQFFSS